MNCVDSISPTAKRRPRRVTRSRDEVHAFRVLAMMAPSTTISRILHAVLHATCVRGIGYVFESARNRDLAPVETTTVIDFTSDEILSTHTIDPDRSYWRTKQIPRPDGRGF